MLKLFAISAAVNHLFISIFANGLLPVVSITFELKSSANYVRRLCLKGTIQYE